VYPGSITNATFSPDGTQIACAPLAHRNVIAALDFSRDGQLLATACQDHTARVWNALTGQPVTGRLTHNYEVTRVAFSPDGARLATLARRGAARLWNARTGEPLTPPLLYKRNAGNGCLSYRPDGKMLLLSRGGDEAWLHDLHPETAGLKELKLRAEVISCTRFDPAAGMTPLDEETLNQDWQELRALHARTDWERVQRRSSH